MGKAKVTFISVDGHGGSGKSTFANQLAQLLHSEVVQIDDFTGQNASTDWYKIFIEKVIEPTMAGASFLSYARAKWWPEHVPGAVLNQPVTPIMIVEGVCASRSELRDYMALKVFIDTPRDICIQRGLKRDRGMGDKSVEEIIALWNQWLAWDDEYFAKDDPKSIADIIIDGTKTYDSSVEAVTAKLDLLNK